MSTKPQPPEAPKSSNPLESDEHAVFVLTPSNSRDHHAAHKFLDVWTKKMTDAPPIESEYRFYELPANTALFMCFPIQAASKKVQAPKVYRPQITGVDPKRETSGLLKITDV